MPFRPNTSPVIRATLAAMRAVDGLRDARLEAATDDAERARVPAEYWDVVRARVRRPRGPGSGPG